MPDLWTGLFGARGEQRQPDGSTFVARWAWWWPLYVGALLIVNRLTGAEIDPVKLKRMMDRALRIEWRPPR
ncbi:MAG: hypothetical protein AB1761_18490 [Pseudomonadota bacterium]